MNKGCKNHAKIFGKIAALIFALFTSKIDTSDTQKCGERGIRTPGTLLRYTRFPGVPDKPLLHLSRMFMALISGMQSKEKKLTEKLFADLSDQTFIQV